MAQSSRSALLFKAAVKGDIATIQSLLTPDFDINECNESKQTALHAAAYFAQEDSVKALLATDRCNLHLTTNLGDTALHCAVRNEYKPYDPEIRKKRINIVNMLIAAGCNPAQVNHAKRSPLHLACNLVHAPIVEKLLENQSVKKSINDKDIVELNPLSTIAVFNITNLHAHLHFQSIVEQQLKIIALLGDHGAPINSLFACKEEKDSSPISCFEAAFNQHLNYVENSRTIPNLTSYKDPRDGHTVRPGYFYSMITDKKPDWDFNPIVKLVTLFVALGADAQRIKEDLDKLYDASFTYSAELTSVNCLAKTREKVNEAIENGKVKETERRASQGKITAVSILESMEATAKLEVKDAKEEKEVKAAATASPTQTSGLFASPTPPVAPKAKMKAPAAASDKRRRKSF